MLQCFPQEKNKRGQKFHVIITNISASKCTVLSVFYMESHVKIRSTERAVKNTKVAVMESDGPC